MKLLLRIALLASLLHPAEAASQPYPPSEHEVKAAFLYNFGKFVEWPRDSLAPADEPLVICLLGDDPIEDALARTVQGRAVQGRRLALRRVNGPQEVGRCHILFIAQSHAAGLASLLRSIAAMPILTVSDIPGFLDQGGGIGLMLQDNRVRFGVNLQSVGRAGLRVSSQLLKIARTVVGK